VKIKQLPDDFRVDELTVVTPSAGPYALYLLEKTGFTTHDAIATLRRLWQLPANVVSFGGLKDRHARTTQHLTIENGPPNDLDHAGLNLKYLGQVPEPFVSTHIQANRFHIVVRDLSSEHTERALAALEVVRADGLANYFDDQRFGSVSEGGEFVARHMVLGNWEQALKLALTMPYEFDRSAEKQIKATLRKHWGDWAACVRKLPRCHARTLAAHLASRPDDFRGAIARLRPELAGLYLSAYQSHLWNRFLASWLTKHLPPQQRLDVRLKLDALPMPRGTKSGELDALVLPLPSARLRYGDEVSSSPPDWPEVLRHTLAGDGVELEQLKLKGLRRPFFSRGERAILCRPAGLAGSTAADERHPTRHKLLLEFNLPRGSYATLLVKRVTT
jgi:tRNA pseudouridine13 synthase